MRKILPLLLGITACLNSCVNKTTKQTTLNTSNFQVVEISYSNGWSRGFSFLIDSSKAFIASPKRDSIEFGVAPDSIFKLIDSTIFVIRNDTTVKTKVCNCADCPVASLKAIVNRDTIRIFQGGNKIDKIIGLLATRLQSFIDNSHYAKTSLQNWETQREVFPPPVPPPPLIRD